MNASNTKLRRKIPTPEERDQIVHADVVMVDQMLVDADDDACDLELELRLRRGGAVE